MAQERNSPVPENDRYRNRPEKYRKNTGKNSGKKVDTGGKPVLSYEQLL